MNDDFHQYNWFFVWFGLLGPDSLSDNSAKSISNEQTANI